MKIPGFFKLRLRRENSAPRQTERPNSPHLALGRLGESLAAEYLEAVGYRLVAANFSVPIGRNLKGAIVRAEVDLVAYDDETLCFVEVKTRASDWYAAPQVNVDLRKQRQIVRAARAYRRLFGLVESTYRFDVITVTLAPIDTEDGPSKPRIELLKNFWSKDKFRKRRWHDGNFDPA